MINMELSKKQVSTMELISELGDKFGDNRWFTQAELPDITKHTMDALVRKGFLKCDEDGHVAYYRLIKRLGDES